MFQDITSSEKTTFTNINLPALKSFAVVKQTHFLMIDYFQTAEQAICDASLQTWHAPCIHQLRVDAQMKTRIKTSIVHEQDMGCAAIIVCLCYTL